MAGFITRLRGRPGTRVLIIPQVTSEQQNDDDRQVGKRLQKLVGRHDNVIFLSQRFSHYDIKALFGCLDYLVGTRFHSVIFALTAGVPALAIEYEHKTSGIMQDLGLDEWVLPMNAVTADGLWRLFDCLTRKSQLYLRQLQKRLPAYTAAARHSSELIKQAYDRRHADTATTKQRKSPRP
jgi:colanic acid/amylovoran biosynthesis protein